MNEDRIDELTDRLADFLNNNATTKEDRLAALEEAWPLYQRVGDFSDATTRSLLTEFDKDDQRIRVTVDVIRAVDAWTFLADWISGRSRWTRSNKGRTI